MVWHLLGLNMINQWSNGSVVVGLYHISPRFQDGAHKLLNPVDHYKQVSINGGTPKMVNPTKVI